MAKDPNPSFDEDPNPPAPAENPAIVTANPDPDAAARDMALMMLLDRHGGSIRVNPTTVDRVTKTGRQIRVAFDATTGEQYVRLDQA